MFIEYNSGIFVNLFISISNHFNLMQSKINEYNSQYNNIGL